MLVCVHGIGLSFSGGSMLWFYIVGVVVGAIWLGGEISIMSKHMPKCISDWVGYVLAKMLLVLGCVGFIYYV